MRSVCALVLAPALVLVCACGSAGAATSASVQVVAAEDVWGSIAAQLGGTHVAVTSIVTDPNADPHEYETTTDDARAFADADYVIVNGAGYDDWAQKLLDANPAPHRVVLDVADLVHVAAGENPHLWYSPAFVAQVMTQITSDLTRIDPHDARAFSVNANRLDAAMQPYRAAVTAVAAERRGTAVAMTEPVAGYLADAMGLRVVSPDAFMHAVEEGTEPSAQSVASFQELLTQRRVRLLIDNVQTVTPITSAMVSLAHAANVPVVGVAEILQPPSARFEDWMRAQVLAIQAALS